MKTMKKLIMTAVVTLLLTATLNATSPEIAVHTGRSEQFTSITGKPGIRCEYQIPQRKFWVSFAGYICPATIEVR